MTGAVPPPDGWMDRALRAIPRGATIFCFHGIRTGQQPDGGGIHVGPDHLAEAVELATELGTIVPLRDMVTRTALGRSTAGLVALTFDDACLSVSTDAAPILRRASAHATIFAVREACESGAPFWWDRLSLCGRHLGQEQSSNLLAALGVPVATPPGGDAARLARDAIVARHCGVMPSAAAAILAAVETKYALAGLYDRAMNSTELTTLLADGHFDIAVHTATHRVLPLLSDAEVEREITTCHDWLRASVGQTLPFLAIPFGLRDARTVPLARRAGMEAVLRIAPRNVGPRDLEEGLPRFSMSERRRGWKLRAALLGVYEWMYATGVRGGSGDPLLPEPRP